MRSLTSTRYRMTLQSGRWLLITVNLVDSGQLPGGESVHTPTPEDDSQGSRNLIPLRRRCSSRALMKKSLVVLDLNKLGVGIAG